VPQQTKAQGQRWWVHLTLLLLTFASAVVANVLPRLPGHSLQSYFTTLSTHPGRLWDGVPFAVTLLAILLAHEMGHYLTARANHVDQSLPYFIPAPTLFGTLGAVILMRTQPRDRQVLLKVAVMGPFAGLLVALPLTAWGLAHSALPGPVDLGGEDLVFGNSLLFGLLKHWFAPNDGLVELHPVALAGWAGLFVTSINLIPAAQLDGGHVAYALLGARQAQLSRWVVVGLVLLGTWVILDTSRPDPGLWWIVWAVLLYFIGIKHPPVRDERLPLTRTQRTAGYLALAVFILTFTPAPIERLPDSNADLNDEVTAPLDTPKRQPPHRRKHRPSRDLEPEEFRL